MALSLATLQSEFLTRVFAANHATFLTAGAGWAKAYRDYVAAAIDCLALSPVALSLDAAEAALSTALAGVFASGSDPSSTATNMDPAFVAFWLVVVFPGQTAPPVAPPGVIGPALIAQWATSIDDAVVAANAHAAIFDAWTRTVVVSHAPGCVAPIT